jgi:hypothetical protein
MRGRHCRAGPHCNGVRFAVRGSRSQSSALAAIDPVVGAALKRWRSPPRLRLSVSWVSSRNCRCRAVGEEKRKMRSTATTWR